MIDSEGLTKLFGGVTAVEALDLHVREGQVFGFLGPNGAGKTTTVRMLTGLIAKTTGWAQIGPYEVGRPEHALKIRRMIGLLPESVGLYDELSAIKNLDFFARLYEVPEPERHESIARLLKMLGIWDWKDQPVGSFSKGMRQKVAVARALVHNPPVLFLDEPTANLDPESTKTVRDFIVSLKREKRTIFLTTHNLDEAQRVCDRIGIMKTRLVRIGTPEELRTKLGPRRTLVRLAAADPAVVARLRSQYGVERVHEEGDSVIVDLVAPDADNPELVALLVAAGARVREVREVIPTLEEVYLSNVRGG